MTQHVWLTFWGLGLLFAGEPGGGDLQTISDAFQEGGPGAGFGACVALFVAWSIASEYSDRFPFETGVIYYTACIIGGAAVGAAVFSTI